MKPIGKKTWIIAEGYIPPTSSSDNPQFVSHETACVVNPSDRDAHLAITLFFADRQPIGPYLHTVPACRTQHIRFNDLQTPEPVPRGIDYSSLIQSDVPVVVQHTRLDSRRAELSIMTTVAYGET
ncbi:MAG: sensory rhodopsin transducer [Terracidiphilus sp.]